MLTNKQKRFAFEYCRDCNATKAAIRAGYSEKTAYSIGSELLSKPEIDSAIEEHKEMVARVATLTPEWILNQWMQIASADPRELIHTRVGCCRHCWGIDNKREWMEHEYATALNEALTSMLLPPAFEGGLGYSPTREPNPDCPKCKGEGISRTWLADSRKLSPQAARLLAGVKQTKDGIEIKMRDQEGALAKLADYLGMQNKSSADVKIAAAILTANADDLTDDQLAAIIAAEVTLGVDAGVYSQPALPANTIEGT